MKELFHIQLKGDKKRLVKGRKGRAMRRWLKQTQRGMERQIDKAKFEYTMRNSVEELILFGETRINPEDILIPTPHNNP